MLGMYKINIKNVYNVYDWLVKAVMCLNSKFNEKTRISCGLFLTRRTYEVERILLFFLENTFSIISPCQMDGIRKYLNYIFPIKFQG